jgi:tRNA (Thr-GGU) A37 N-methylase
VAEDSYAIRPIGRVSSPLTDRESAPKQGFEGAPDAWLAFDPDVAEGIRDLAVGADVFVLTWLHRARIAAIDGLRVRVHGLEAFDGTPVVDVKAVLTGGQETGLR